ncbi:SDR family NAD(P)-dependent oxidoreductase [Actinospica robiniae]|uniref:SDR family NAD(P)-dependent oxidoreductase n=1 Tax=Actinospica robiniae TaxID=304901 RepID=UPI000686E279|nr:SDR family NAD(P)-dependent oxidoreductase [Actinospica robiniae]
MTTGEETLRMAPTRQMAVVTGASSGIGSALADELVEQGFDLVVAAEDEGIVETAERLTARGAVVRPVRADLSTFDGVEQLVSATGSVGRPIEVLAVNAGVGAGGGGGGDFARDLDLDTELRLVALNCAGSVHLAKRMLPDMVERHAGKVLFTSSIAAAAPGPYHAVYEASKAFVGQLSQSLREELRDTGVTVTSLMPGPADTKFFKRARTQDTKPGSGPKEDPADVAREAYQGLMAGKDHVVVGSWRSKAQAAAARVMPATAGAKTQRSTTESGSDSSSDSKG